MMVYVIYDQLHDRVREVHSDENKAYQRCDELDKLWGNDSILPHVAIKFEVDKQYKDYERGE